MKRFFVALMLVCSLAASAAVNEVSGVRIGLFQDQVVSKVVVYCSGGSYALLCDGEQRATLSKGEILYLSLEEKQIRVLDAHRDFGQTGLVELKALEGDAMFRMRPVDPELDGRVYDGELEVRPADRFLKLVNRVDLDFYLAGVVEAEGGAGAPSSYYRAQAILCRTFAMKNMHRHDGEIFSLCDQVHCQAYKGRNSKDPAILEAVLETTGMVATDNHYKLITAAYHSNILFIVQIFKNIAEDRLSGPGMCGCGIRIISSRWWTLTPCIRTMQSGRTPYPLRNGKTT